MRKRARSLGLGWFAVTVRVLAPLAGPGVGAGAAMVFVFVVTELTATLLLAPIGTRTLAIEVWANTSSLAFAAAAPFAAMMLVISLVFHLASRAPFRRRRISRSGVTMADVRIAGLTKSFRGAPILRGVDLVVPSGALFAILGASGSGKTTLLRLLSGFERADSGVIEIGGRQAAGPGVHVPPERRQVGYVAQEGSLFPHLSVAANVLFGLARSQRRDRLKAEALLESVGLPASYASRGPHELSGGEQQRVALARALAPRPKLVLLDEPFSALDAALRIETREAVAAILEAAGATALLVTHDQSEALSMGRQVAVLRDGVLAQVAAPEKLYRQPADADLAQFVGEAVLLPGLVAGRVRHLRAGAARAGAARRPTGLSK